VVVEPAPAARVAVDRVPAAGGGCRAGPGSRGWLSGRPLQPGVAVGMARHPVVAVGHDPGCRRWLSGRSLQPSVAVGAGTLYPYVPVHDSCSWLSGCLCHPRAHHRPSWNVPAHIHRQVGCHAIPRAPFISSSARIRVQHFTSRSGLITGLCTCHIHGSGYHVHH
jgi:hypothetical protein